MNSLCKVIPIPQQFAQRPGAGVQIVAQTVVDSQCLSRVGSDPQSGIALTRVKSQAAPICRAYRYFSVAKRLVQLKLQGARQRFCGTAFQIICVQRDFGSLTVQRHRNGFPHEIIRHGFFFRKSGRIQPDCPVGIGCKTAACTGDGVLNGVSSAVNKFDVSSIHLCADTVYFLCRQLFVDNIRQRVKTFRGFGHASVRFLRRQALPGNIIQRDLIRLRKSQVDGFSPRVQRHRAAGDVGWLDGETLDSVFQLAAFHAVHAVECAGDFANIGGIPILAGVVELDGISVLRRSH